jgi:hypothetical protein
MPPAIATPLIVLALVAGTYGMAAAQSCGSEIDRLARQYNLSTEAPRAGTPETPATPANPPAGAGSGTTTTERLAQSGGVLTPPDTSAPMAIQPPRSNPDRMPTAPKAAPGPGPSADASGLTAADRARMEGLLQGARAAERQGKQEQCLERLREAEAVPRPPAAK